MQSNRHRTGSPHVPINLQPRVYTRNAEHFPRLCGIARQEVMHYHTRMVITNSGCAVLILIIFGMQAQLQSCTEQC